MSVRKNSSRKALPVLAAALLLAVACGCGRQEAKYRKDTVDTLKSIADEVITYYNESIKRNDEVEDTEELRRETITWFMERVRDVRETGVKVDSETELSDPRKKELLSMCLTVENLILSTKEAYRRITTNFDVDTGNVNLEAARSSYTEFEKAAGRKKKKAKKPGVEVTAKKYSNVLFILIDTVRADHLSCHGYERLTTPVIDKIASEGVLFENAMAQASNTHPSVASILTGLYSSHHKLVSYFEWESHRSLVSRFKQSGYRTAAFSANPLAGPGKGFGVGFDHFFLKEQVTADVINNEIYKWMLDNEENSPYFLYVHYMDPHDKYNAPDPFTTIFDPPYFRATDVVSLQDALREINVYDFDLDATGWMSREAALRLIREHTGALIDERAIDNLIAYYDGELRFADYQVGQLLGAFRRKGLLDNTVVVITSDHGEAFLEHGFVKHGPTLYDEMTHVPLILWDGGRRIKPRRVGELVELAGVMPTVMELAGLEVPAGLDAGPLPVFGAAGKNIGRSNYAHSATWYGWSFKEKITIRKFCVRSGTHKLIYTPRYSLYELYDLRTDPAEHENLIGIADAEVTEPLMKELKSYVRDYRWFDKKKKVEIDSETQRQLKQLGYVY
ncbi:MAG: sulfatase [bacterium]